MKHFLNTQDWSRSELDALLARASLFKRNRIGDQLRGKSIALVFFNPSLRTRTSFEIGAFQLGGHAVVLQPGKDAWPIEFDLRTVMDGDAEEHIAEVARAARRAGRRGRVRGHDAPARRRSPKPAPRRVCRSEPPPSLPEASGRARCPRRSGALRERS